MRLLPHLPACLSFASTMIRLTRLQPVVSAAVASLFVIKHFPGGEPPSAADAERVEWDVVLKSLARDSVRGYVKLTEPWDMYALISTVIVLVFILIRRAAARFSTPCSPTSTTLCCLACG
jgi:hypothetical protein